MTAFIRQQIGPDTGDLLWVTAVLLVCALTLTVTVRRRLVRRAERVARPPVD